MTDSIACPHCSARSSATARFCGSCGSRLHAEPPPSSASAADARPGPRGDNEVTSVFRVAIEPERVTVVAGREPPAVQVRVYNLSEVVEEFTISLAGSDTALHASPRTLRLLPNTDETATLQLQLVEGQLVAAGIYRPVIDVHARGVHDRHIRTPIEVAVPASDSQLEAELEPTSVRAGRSAQLRATVTNPGNAPVQVVPRATDPEALLRFRFRPRSAELPAGGSGVIRIDVEAPSRPWTGTERTRPFTVELVDRAGSESVSASGTFVQPPRLTDARRTALRWALRLTFTIIGSLALIGGAFATWTVQPVVRTGLQWSIPDHLERVLRGVVSLRPLDPAVPDALVSAGMGVIVLGALALLGLVGRGGVSRLAAGVAFLALVGFFVTLALTGPLTLASGAWLCLGGALLAFVGGLLGRR